MIILRIIRVTGAYSKVEVRIVNGSDSNIESYSWDYIIN